MDEYTSQERYIWSRVFKLNDLKQRLLITFGREFPELEAFLNRLVMAAEAVTGIGWTEAMPLYESIGDLVLGQAVERFQDYLRDLSVPLHLSIGEYLSVSRYLSQIVDEFGTNHILLSKST